MKTRLISGIIMMMALVACTQEETLNNEFGLKKLKTEVEGYHTSSRVGFTDKDAAFFWTKGDKIGVTTSNSSTFQGMTLSGDGGSATGDFSGSMSGNPSGYAVYPYGQMGRHSVNNDELTYTLPASYTYKTLDATYAKADGNSYNAPMWGKVNNGSVSFKHLSGVIAFEVNGLPENTSGKFILTASNKINGTFTANLKDSEPVITSEATDVPAEKTITISFTTAEGQNKGYFYVPVPIGSLGNLMLSIVDGDENEIASGAWDNITINRKDIKRAVIGEQSISGGMVQEIEGIDEITNEILTSEEEELIVQITEEVSGTENTIILPQTLQTEVTTFSFASVAEGAAITIQNAVDASYSGQIIIEIPENETIPTVTANIPDGEVYIKQGTVTKLVTSSADNTTIIGAKAKIETLIVQKGNVRIEDGGKVQTIQRQDNQDNVTYVIYESATAPTIELGEGVLLVSAAEFDLLTDVANGGEIVLTSEIVLTTPLVIADGKTVTIDLNGHIISQCKECAASYSMITNKGALTIKDTSSEGDGKITFQDLSNGGGDTWGSYVITNNGTLVVENGTLEHLGSANPEAHNTNLPIQNYAGKVTINGGVISSKDFRSLRDFTAGGEIIINGGVFEGQVWMQGLGNGSSSLTVNDGEFSPLQGYDGSSVYITNGTNDIIVSINGGKFNTKIGCVDATKEGIKGSVKGGIFTESAKTNTNNALIAEGCAFVEAVDGYWEIEKSWEKTSETSYTIYSANGMRWLAEQVNSGQETFKDKTILLAADIDLNDEQWTPIGTEEKNFQGIFDGQTHTLKNLYVVETEAKEGKAFIGFFGYAKNATIKNVTFENVNLNIACLDIDHSQGHIGAVAGSLEGTSTIENVTVKGDIKVESTVTANGASRVAVVAGGNSYGNVTMKNVHVIANEGSYLKANNNVGALAGQLQGKSIFENCSSNIDVTGTKFFAGGIIGLAAGDQTFTDCHTTGDITITTGREGRVHDHYRVGGIAGGWADGAKNVCTLTNCSYTGKISGTNADGSVAETFDYAGYVGRGYTLNNCQGSKVIIDGIEYVQAYNTAVESGIYYIDDVMTINSVADLKLFADKVNNGTNYFEGKTIKLGADIDLNNEEWTPIGSATKDHGFMGNFDGNGKAIKNLQITNIELDEDGYAYAGLFGVTEGIDKDNQNYIKNLTIENVKIETEGHIVAAAIAYPYYTIAENISVKGNITIKGGDYTAGVLAYTRRCVNAKDLTIEGNEGSLIEGKQTVGGVISDIQMNGGLTANYSNFAASGLTIKGTKHVGGISGIISLQTLDGAEVENVVINCDDARKGTVSGALGGKSTIKNISVNNVIGATSVVGATYDNAAAVVVNGDVYEGASTNTGE